MDLSAGLVERSLEKFKIDRKRRISACFSSYFKKNQRRNQRNQLKRIGQEKDEEKFSISLQHHASKAKEDLPIIRILNKLTNFQRIGRIWLG